MSRAIDRDLGETGTWNLRLRDVSKYDVNHVDWHNLTAEEVEAIRLYLKRTREKTNGEYIPDESSRW